jgi:Tol biopolymer transport system component
VAPVPFSDEYRVTVARDGDILVIDTNRGDVETRITDNGGNYYPVPTPDGRYVLYVRNQTLFQKLANGTGQEEKIADGVTGATEFTRDGNFLSFFGQPPNTLTLDDLFILPMSGNRTPQKYLATNLTEYENRLSPDQKFMAYGSEQSGRPEVYVQTNPISDQRWQISLEGGVQPIWSWDGKELFYLALDGTLMSVDVSPPPAFDKTVPRALFRINGPVGYTRNTYLPSRDGKRFLVNAYVDGSTSSIAVIVNWPELVAGH